MTNYRFPPNESRDREYWITNFFKKIKDKYGFSAGFEAELLDTFDKDEELQNASPNFELEGDKELWLGYLNPMLLHLDLNDPTGEEVYEFLKRDGIIIPIGPNRQDGGGNRKKKKGGRRRKSIFKKKRRKSKKSKKRSKKRSRKTRRKLNKRSRRRSRRKSRRKSRKN